MDRLKRRSTVGTRDGQHSATGRTTKKKEKEPPFHFEIVGDEYAISASQKSTIEVVCKSSGGSSVVELQQQLTPSSGQLQPSPSAKQLLSPNVGNDEQSQSISLLSPLTTGGGATPMETGLKAADALVDYYLTVCDDHGRPLETVSLGKKPSWNSGLGVSQSGAGISFQLSLFELQQRKVGAVYFLTECIVAETGDPKNEGVPSTYNLFWEGSKIADGNTELPTGLHTHLVFRYVTEDLWAVTKVWLPLPEKRRARATEFETMLKKLRMGWKPNPGIRSGGYKYTKASTSLGEELLVKEGDYDTQSTDSGDDGKYTYQGAKPLTSPTTAVAVVGGGGELVPARKPRPRVVRERQRYYSTGRSVKGSSTYYGGHINISQFAHEADDDADDESDDDNGDIGLRLPMFNAGTTMRYEDRCYNLGSSPQVLKQHAARHHLQYLTGSDGAATTTSDRTTPMMISTEVLDTPTPPETPEPPTAPQEASPARAVLLDLDGADAADAPQQEINGVQESHSPKQGKQAPLTKFPSLGTSDGSDAAPLPPSTPDGKSRSGASFRQSTGKKNSPPSATVSPSQSHLVHHHHQVQHQQRQPQHRDSHSHSHQHHHQQPHQHNGTAQHQHNGTAQHQHTGTAQHQHTGTTKSTVRSSGSGSVEDKGNFPVLSPSPSKPSGKASPGGKKQKQNLMLTPQNFFRSSLFGPSPSSSSTAATSYRSGFGSKTKRRPIGSPSSTHRSRGGGGGLPSMAMETPSWKPEYKAETARTSQQGARDGGEAERKHREREFVRTSTARMGTDALGYLGNADLQVWLNRMLSQGMSSLPQVPSHRGKQRKG